MPQWRAAELASSFYISNVSLSLSAASHVFARTCVPAWLQMCRGSACTVWPAMLHYFLCVLLNLFTPELALPVIHVRNASLAHGAQPGPHSYLSVCCYFTPSTPSPDITILWQKWLTNMREKEGANGEREASVKWVNPGKTQTNTRNLKEKHTNCD